jgi:hypothetical protein
VKLYYHYFRTGVDNFVCRKIPSENVCKVICRSPKFAYCKVCFRVGSQSRDKFATLYCTGVHLPRTRSDWPEVSAKKKTSIFIPSQQRNYGLNCLIMLHYACDLLSGSTVKYVANHSPANLATESSFPGSSNK